LTWYNYGRFEFADVCHCIYPSESYRKIAGFLPLFLHVPVPYHPSRVDYQPAAPQGVQDPGFLFNQYFTPFMSSYKHYTYEAKRGAMKRLCIQKCGLSSGRPCKDSAISHTNGSYSSSPQFLQYSSSRRKISASTHRSSNSLRSCRIDRRKSHSRRCSACGPLV
jgi:hypothetical protein